ncbi:MAG: Stk1 family PASTA domain-containing Ser/Thr kinase [Tissierellia bacterium]|nr:Stk1 family PASTA domain-containing Ser/Thr kinase [Tissierellia bacterium]
MIGTVLGSRYEINEKVGAGGMAHVYKARCRLLNRNVAIKILRDEYVNDEEFIKKFRRESQAAASLSHPNIVNVYDVGMDEIDGNKIYYIVMEYINGKTLKEIIREKGKLSLEETLDFSIQIAEALEHAHKNHIVHRDIKPHNIMITEDGRVKVTDFGIARAATASTVTNTSNVIGSVHYFSPEQARGGYTDEKSDIYSLGIVIYEMITGKVPYEGDSPISVALKHIQDDIVPPREIDNTIPIGLENIIMKCVQKSQSDRYKSASELLRDLRRLKYSLNDGSIEDTAMIQTTQIMSAVDNKGGDNMKKGPKESKKDGGFKLMIAAILLAFVVVAAGAYGFYRLKDYFVTKEVEVPNLVGMNVEMAEEELDSRELKLRIGKEIPSSEFKKGDIIDQKTKAGDKVKPGYTIEVIVSSGGNYTKVPSLIGKSITEIDAILSEYKVEEGEVKPQPSDTIEANIIMNQYPEPYTEVEEGTKIDLVVSQGPEKKTVLMPKLIDRTEGEAKSALEAFGLIKGSTGEDYSDEYEAGKIIWQSVEAGVAVETGTKIDITISKGPEPEPEPVEEKEVPFNVNLTLPNSGGEIEVIVERIQDGVAETVYKEIHEADGKTIKIPLKGKLDAEFRFYYDGEYSDTEYHPNR